MGYNVTWERLKSEYGQGKLLVNAHVEEIVNLLIVNRSNYLEVQEFYESSSRNYDALFTMRELTRRYVAWVRDIHSQQTTTSVALYSTNWRQLRELGYGGCDNQLASVVLKKQTKWPTRNLKRTSQERKAQVYSQRKWPSNWSREWATPSCMYCKKDHWRHAGNSFTTISFATTAENPANRSASAELGAEILQMHGQTSHEYLRRGRWPGTYCIHTKVEEANPTSHNTCPNQRNHTLGVLEDKRRRKLHFAWGSEEAKTEPDPSWNPSNRHVEWNAKAVHANLWLKHRFPRWKGERKNPSHRYKDAILYNHLKARFNK